MLHRGTDDAEYLFLTVPQTELKICLIPDARDGPELQLFGNRAGLLSLANILLWLLANRWRREFLSLVELPFVQATGLVSVYLRLTLDEGKGRDGLISRIDHSDQFEWVFAEDDLRRFALRIHSLVCNPAHEYDLLQVEEGSAVGVHVRMTDVMTWLPTLQG
jgi:hypothetical protein